MNEDFSLGKMNADARLTATFKYYEKRNKMGNHDNRLSGRRGCSKLKRGYGLDGNETVAFIE